MLLMDLKGSDDRVIVIVTCSVLPTTPSRRRRALRSRATEGLAAFDQLLNVPMPSSFERARLVATCLTQSGSDSPAPPSILMWTTSRGRCSGFAPRAVVRVVDAARKGATRRKPRASVLESDFDMVLDAVPSLDTLAPNRGRRTVWFVTGSRSYGRRSRRRPSARCGRPTATSRRRRLSSGGGDRGLFCCGDWRGVPVAAKKGPQRPRQRKMLLINCAACAAPLANDAPRCVRCRTPVFWPA